MREFRLEGGRPGDERGFLHKKILGIVSKVAGGIPIIGPAVSSIAGALAGSGQQQEAGRQVKFGNGNGGNGGRFRLGHCASGWASTTTGECIAAGFVPDPLRLPGGAGFAGGACPPGLMRGPQGLCIAPTSPLGASRLVGEATMGRYGAALVPGSRIVDRAVCLRGMQLGDDGLCYNKSQISNKQRMWPAGRRPLLSGGDMRAISIASRAAKRLEGTTKRLQKMGMIKKAAPRRIGPGHHHHPAQVPAGS